MEPDTDSNDVNDRNDRNDAVKERASPVQEKPKRRVVIGPKVRVMFDDGSGADPEVVEVNRDVFSVMDSITERLSRTKDRAEMEAIRVSVNSFEDESKSEPRAEGEPPAVLPYLVGGVTIDGLSIPDAMSELTKAIVPGDAAVRQFEILTEQLFLRSMMGCCTVVAGFPTGNAIVPLINSMRDVDPRAVVGMYHGLIDAAEKLKEFVPKAFPDKKFDFSSNPAASESEPKPGPSIATPDAPAPSAARKEVVLPSGLPASVAVKGVVTAEEHRKTQIPVVHLT